MSDIGYELQAINDSRKSFYGKARVVDGYNNDKVKALFSYDTLVAFIDTSGNMLYQGWFSATTARHIQEFAKQERFYCGGKQWLEEVAGTYRDKAGDQVIYS